MARRRSLLKDGNDIKTFRHHRDRHIGHCVSNEYYQQTPFFFTRECAPLNLVGQYKGASIFVILNGPSLVNGDYDLSLLKAPGVMTYGVNQGPATVRPTFWSCVDDPQRFLKSIWLDPAITKFVPHAHSEKPIFDNENWSEMKVDGKKVLVGECPNCIFFHRNEKFEASRWLFEDKINWGNSGNYGGGRSVMLPVLRICFLLGFRKVYLLGADFKMSSEYAYHFDEKREKGAVKCNTNTYRRMNEEYFPQLQPYFKEEGFEIYNCNPDSGLTCFDYMSFDDAIAEAMGKLGNVGSERTWGMYCKPGEKDKTKEEPDDSEKQHLKNLAKREELLRKAEASSAINIKPVASQKPVVSQEPVVKTTKIEKPIPEETKPYKVVSVDNSNANDVTVSSSRKLPVCSTKTNIKKVTVKPKVEKVEEVPKAINSTDQVAPKARKLIKRLPFRS